MCSSQSSMGEGEHVETITVTMIRALQWEINLYWGDREGNKIDRTKTYFD